MTEYRRTFTFRLFSLKCRRFDSLQRRHLFPTISNLITFESLQYITIFILNITRHQFMFFDYIKRNGNQRFHTGDALLGLNTFHSLLNFCSHYEDFKWNVKPEDEAVFCPSLMMWSYFQWSQHEDEIVQLWTLNPSNRRHRNTRLWETLCHQSDKEVQLLCRFWVRR